MALPQGTTGSTMPRRQLGRHLRDLRNRAGMTTRTAAQRLEWSEAKIWRIETGQTSLRSLDVEAMCKIYGAPSELVGPLTALARETKARGWWTTYGDAIPESFEIYIGLEEAALQLSTFENALVPGLLQTEDYARAVLAEGRPGSSPGLVDRRVQLRMTRQNLITRADAPVQLDAIIDESVLWRRVGGVEVSGAQIDHLRRMCDLPNVRLRTVPPDAGFHPGLESGPFVLLGFGEGSAGAAAEPPVVYVESFTGPVYVDKDLEIDRYRAAFAGIAAAAVDARPLLDEVRAALA
ncbi:helix-turn-helix domain-containing protein [Nocardia puris]|uniref:Helix-turn-helix protein n=1 Tax=Nocardia puris TaxID=208602 RepID=A0A366DP14_9NOCA|nr:helix-turn-helix transcriptional regulator [Nocardia puris]RBO91840.1 helix-turn-helix protein [Nocardia puris]